MTDGKIISENNKARADDNPKDGSAEEVGEVSSKNAPSEDDEEIEVMVEGEDGELERVDEKEDEKAAAGAGEEVIEAEVVEETAGGEGEETVEAEVVEETAGGEGEETVEAEVVEETVGGEKGEETVEGEVVEVVEDVRKEDPRISALQEELDEVKAERDKLLKDTSKLKERVLRSAADMENLRRRTRREINENNIKSKETVISEMLTVVDNLERAIEHVESDGSLESMVEGVKLVLRQFSTAMEKFGVEAFSSKGKPFDPVYHEAIGQVESKELEPNTVVEEWQKGYQIDGRLLRPSVVVVSKTPMNEESESSESGKGEGGEDEGGKGEGGEDDGGKGEGGEDDGGKGEGSEDEGGKGEGSEDEDESVEGPSADKETKVEDEKVGDERSDG